ncbi:unnamed protein product, partial [Ectocarpus fasciculatus]
VPPEDTDRSQSFASQLPPGDSEGAPRFPIEIFESLENVTSDPRLCYCGHAIDPNHGDRQVRSKLSRETPEYLITPRAEGGSIGLWLRGCPGLRIAAVRVQLGHASVDHIPRELRIMGRTIQTQKGKAKWYDLPLTEQEIERGNAVGPVVVSVSSCADASNHPLIDALEVYARPYQGGAAAGAPAPPLPPGPARSSSSSRTDEHQPSALAASTMEALEACSRVLSHALGLAAEAAPTREALCPELAGSSLTVLRKTCLATDKTRWRALRSSSHRLLAAAQPDAASRADSVHRAYVGEVLLALAGDGGGDGGGGGDGNPSKESSFLSPVRLTRVTQLCERVCAKRSTLLRGELAPALADKSHGDGGGDSVGQSGRRPQLASRFVFPALVRRFWESCVWGRDGRGSMQMVLRCILQLAVDEMRAAAVAARTAAANGARGSSSGDLVEEASEQAVLRAGLGQLIPLLQSNVARVSEASSAYLATLLLGTLPAATATAAVTRPTAAAASRTAAAAATDGQRQAESAGGAAGVAASGGEDGLGSGAANAAATGVVLSSRGGVVSDAYAASAGSASEAEGRIETEATSDGGTESDAEPAGEAAAAAAADDG